MFEIINRYTKAVLYKSESADSAKDAVVEAVRSDANLYGANLRGADLGYANLGGANLRGADLGYANLGGANLRGANLGGADLVGADLGGADLRGVNLRCANLVGADLVGADLGGADLGDLKKKLLPAAPDARALRLQVANHIEAHPELHDQTNWGEGTADPSCGTPCCVAGWACHLGGGRGRLTVSSAASILLHVDGLPTPSFDADASREEILAALRTTEAAP